MNKLLHVAGMLKGSTKVPESVVALQKTGSPNQRISPLDDGYFLSTAPEGARRWHLCRLIDQYPGSTLILALPTRRAIIRYYQRCVQLDSIEQGGSREVLDALALEEWRYIQDRHGHLTREQQRQILSDFTPFQPAWWTL